MRNVIQLLPLLRDGNPLKLAVPDNYRVIIARRNARAELLPIGALKVLFRSNQNAGRGIEADELGCPLLSQMIWDDKKRLLTKPKPLGFHRCCHHFKRFPCPHFVRQQRIAAVQDVCNSVPLMLAKLNFRGHAAEGDVPPVVLTGAGGIEQLIVLRHQRFAPVRFFPNPLAERRLDGLLLLLRQRRFLLVEDAPLLSIRVSDHIIDADIPQIQRVLQYPVGVCPSCAIRHIRGHAALGYRRFPRNVPFCRIFRKVHMNHPMQIHRRREGFEHKVLNHRLVQPRCPQPHVDFGSIQILGLRGFQSGYVRKIQGILRCCLHRLPQFLPHIARQIFVGSHINVLIRNRENNAVQFLGQLFRLNARQLRHVGQVNPRFLRNGDGQRFRRCIDVHNGRLLANCPLGEHIRLACQSALLIEDFQRAEQIIGRIARKHAGVASGIDEPVLCRKRIVVLIQPCLYRRKGGIIRIVQLRLNEVVHLLPEVNHAADALQCRQGQFLPDHNRVRAVIYLAVHHCEGVIFHIGVSWNRVCRCFTFQLIRQFCCLIFSADMLHRLGQLLGKHCTFQRDARGFILVAVKIGFTHHCPQHHFRMRCEIAVDRNAVCRLSQMHPSGFDRQRALAFLQKEDVRRDFRAGIRLERCVRQPNRA